MGFFFNRKKTTEETARQDSATSREVEELKRQAHQTIAKTNKDINNLNDLLRANGITLNISIATGGHHNDR